MEFQGNRDFDQWMWTSSVWFSKLSYFKLVWLWSISINALRSNCPMNNVHFIIDWPQDSWSWKQKVIWTLQISRSNYAGSIIDMQRVAAFVYLTAFSFIFTKKRFHRDNVRVARFLCNRFVIVSCFLLQNRRSKQNQSKKSKTKPSQWKRWIKINTIREKLIKRWVWKLSLVFNEVLS